MKRRTSVILLGSAVVVLIVVAAVWLFTPLVGRAHYGPMRGAIMPMGAMSMGMMREMRSVADVNGEFDYLARMIPHHEEAVDTARTLRERTERPQMRRFATDIIETQTREIDRMREWLVQWYPDRRTDVDYQPMMGDYSGLSGDQLDRAFLEDMIPHHMAAVMMSQQLIVRELAEHEQVEDLAETIRNAQLQEIQQMGVWLDRWFGR